MLVSDVGMPDIDGYEMIRRIRTADKPATRLLPAIAVTAYANPEDRIGANVAGFQIHLAKPVDPALVAASIASFVSPPAGAPDLHARTDAISAVLCFRFHGGCMRLCAGVGVFIVLMLQTGALSAQQGLGGAAPAVSANLLQCNDVAAALTAVANQDTRLRDWANLGRYRDANRTAKPDVVFIGDSITDFWQQERFGGFLPGKNYADRGISAQTTPQMLIRFRADVIALKPKAVIILAGTNDIAGNTGPMTNEEIQNNIASMSELAKANNVRVVLSSILPVSEYHVANETVVPQTTRRPDAGFARSTRG